MGRVAQAPPRHKRILFDSYHSLKYPEAGYIASDEQESVYPYDWRGDSLYTNYIELYQTLVDLNFHVDILSHSFGCVDASRYGIYIIADPEARFTDYEVRKIQYDIEEMEVSLFVLGEWYDERFEEKVFNYNLNSYVSPVSGGSDIRSLNALLEPYFIEFAQASYSGRTKLGGTEVEIKKGSPLI
jgi:hypothetical protein